MISRKAHPLHPPKAVFLPAQNVPPKPNAILTNQHQSDHPTVREMFVSNHDSVGDLSESSVTYEEVM
jgi:hypothetical protein